MILPRQQKAVPLLFIRIKMKLILKTSQIDNSDTSNVNAHEDLNDGQMDETELLVLLSEICDSNLGSNDLPQPRPCHQLPMADTIKLIQGVTESDIPNRDGVQYQIGNLNIPVWNNRFEGYGDKEDVVKGNSFGWELGMGNEPVLVSSYRNHPSATQFESFCSGIPAALRG